MTRSSNHSCLPERSRNAGAKAVEVVVDLEERLAKLRAQYNEDLDPKRAVTVEEVVARMEEEDRIRAEISKTTRRLNTTYSMLGEEDLAELTRLKDSDYLLKVVNARALKVRIRTRVIDRKFELTRMERACLTSKPGMWR